MSSNLMDTEPGGEQTQYEAEHNDTLPTSKSGGQLGQPQTAVDTKPSAEAAKTAAQGTKTAEKIRYGQGVSESGMGGFTTGQEGGVGVGEGMGKAVGKGGVEGEGKGTRRAEG